MKLKTKIYNCKSLGNLYTEKFEKALHRIFSGEACYKTIDKKIIRFKNGEKQFYDSDLLSHRNLQ